MTVIGHFFRYNLHGMVALSDRKGLQKPNLPQWQLNFTGFRATAHLRDAFVAQDELKLHSGLELFVAIEGDPAENIEPIVDSMITQIAGLMSFVAVASQGKPRLLSHFALHDDGTDDAQFFSYLLGGSEMTIGTPRAIDEKLFNEVWERWDVSPNKDRLMRAMSWFQKGLAEDAHVDRFISFWVALEIVKSVLRRQLQQTTRNPNEWDGVRDVYASIGGTPTFAEVYEARQELLHGFKEFSPGFFKKVESYVPAARHAAILGISRALGLTQSSTRKLLSLEPLRLLEEATMEMDGTATGLPHEVGLLMADPPAIVGKLNSVTYTMNPDGKLNFNFNYAQTAHLPANCVFTARKGGVIGHGEAGIEGASSSGQ